MQWQNNHKGEVELCKPWGVGRGRVATGWLPSHGLIEVVHNLRIISGGDDEIGGTTLRKKSHTERFLPNNRADLKPKLNTYRSTIMPENDLVWLIHMLIIHISTKPLIGSQPV